MVMTYRLVYIYICVCVNIPLRVGQILSSFLVIKIVSMMMASSFQ
jgi:hypothetical protein